MNLVNCFVLGYVNMKEVSVVNLQDGGQMVLKVRDWAIELCTVAFLAVCSNDAYAYHCPACW